MTIVRVSSMLFVLVCLTVCGLGATATPAAAQAWPVQRVTLAGMWADVVMPPAATAGEIILIQVDFVPHEGGTFPRDRRVTLDLAPLGLERTVDFYDVPGDGFPTLIYENWVSLYAQPGDVLLRFTASADLGRGGTFELPLRVLPPADADADTLPDVWETRFGLSPTVATGVDGPDGDPDGDGRANRDEYLRRSHPRGLYTRYFPEGVQSDFFTHALDALPLSGAAGTLLIRAFDGDGLAEARAGDLDLSPRTAAGSFAQMVESDVPFAASRATAWPNPFSGFPFGYGSHGSEGTPVLSTRWLFAEGVTSPFDTYLLLMNPSTQTATVTVTYIGGGGVAPVVRQHTIGPERRASIAVNGDAAGLASTDTAIIVDSSIPIAAERSIYLSAGGQIWGAGTSSVGAPAAGTAWYFAEGLVNSLFDTYLLLLNPGDTAAEVSIEVLRADGLPPLVIGRALPPRTRITVPLNSAHPELAHNTSFGLTVRSTNGVPIAAERTMWWDDPVRGTNWVEGHTTAGAAEPATRWSAAGHWVAGAGGPSAYLLIANPGDMIATARVSRPRMFGASPPEQTVTVPPRSRITLDLAVGFAPALISTAPVLVESLGPSPVPIVVERSVYANTFDATWTLGSNALLTPVP